MLYFNILVCAKGFKGSALTNCSRGIHNAWHLYYALNFGIKVVSAASVLRCSPLSRALCLIT